MASNDDDETPDNGLYRGLEDIFGAVAQPELERLAIDAVREYRASVVRAETARLELVAADADASFCPVRKAELRRLHQQAETAHRAHQLVLNNLVDRLGYVPKIPSSKPA